MIDKRVGLIVLVDLPLDAPNMRLTAVLRERGLFNLEKGASETWPGLCQVTAHGRIKSGETPIIALLREVREELGWTFAFAVEVLILRDPSVLGEVAHVTLRSKEIRTFAIKVDVSLLAKIRLDPQSGTIRFVTEDDLAGIKGVDEVDPMASDRRTIVMFPDEKQALAKAFAARRLA